MQYRRIVRGIADIDYERHKEEYMQPMTQYYDPQTGQPVYVQQEEKGIGTLKMDLQRYLLKALV